MPGRLIWASAMKTGKDISVLFFFFLHQLQLFKSWVCFIHKHTLYIKLIRIMYNVSHNTFKLPCDVPAVGNPQQACQMLNGAGLWNSHLGLSFLYHRLSLSQLSFCPMKEIQLRLLRIQVGIEYIYINI